MKFFRHYIRDRLKNFLLFFVCAAVFIAAFFLYHLPLGAVIYPAGLCMIFAAVWLAVDYFKAKRKHEELIFLCRLPENLPQALEKYNRVWDEDYKALIETLVEKEKEAEEQAEKNLAETVDYYTAWVHQIKIPISSMALTLQNEDTPVSRMLLKELFRIEQYVEMVLCYLRLNSESTDYLFREYPLDGIIKNSVKKFASQFIGKGIRLVYKETGKTVLTDEKWLSFVLDQLLSNALKYTPEGSISIYTEDPLILCITDTGIGIAAEDLPRILERGYTGCNGRTYKRATGLGLYLCSRICGRLGHTIEINSQAGRGTTVKIGLYKEKTFYE